MKKIYFLLLILIQGIVYGQTELVFVFFKDKPNKAQFYANPSTELSLKSINRRENLNIPLNDSDAPIEINYIQNIKNLGFTVDDQSKWLNGVAVNATSTDIETLKSQPYVLSVESFVKNKTAGKTTHQYSKFDQLKKSSKTAFNYGNSADQIDQVNLRQLHALGYTGKGITIAVMDTEFPTVNSGSAYARMGDNNQIKGTYNFRTKSEEVYANPNSDHGAKCLGIIGGYIDGTFVGSAPDADFYLYTTEYAPQEIPEEELYWIQAAEQADRVGVDIISTSLGYANGFTDPRYDYSFADMTGSRTFIARGAQYASDKGIIVLIAAGNEGDDVWKRVVSPADNPSVFTIGANTNSGTPSSFSSYGPNATGHQKPDASARGTATYYAYNNGSSSGNGTSYSTPLAAGGVACLLQALGSTTDRESIKNRLRETASLYPSYNEQIGNGILNFYNAYEQLTLSTSNKSLEKNIKIYPNPAKSYFKITTTSKVLMVEIYDNLGKLITSLSPQDSYSLERLNIGLYFIKIKTDKGTTIEKLLKH